MPGAFAYWFVGLTIGMPIALVAAFSGAAALHRRRLRRDGRTVRALVSGMNTDPGDGMSSPTYWALAASYVFRAGGRRRL